jgi:hypothetical protein
MTRFVDLPFKLLVVEELMYEQGVLTPRFDCYDHLRALGIEDPDDYAYDEPNFAKILPECRTYFEELEIPAPLLASVTSLTADGGNRAFLQAAPSWDGEDDLFDVRSLADLDKLPNLREFCGDEGWLPDGAAEVLAARGIEWRP